MNSEEFITYKIFNDKESLINFGETLEENKIEYLFENISLNFDPILPNNEFGKEFRIKLKKIDFEKADKILIEKAKSDVKSVKSDYYLYNYSNEELYEIIYKSDEWSNFDVELSKKLLKERGKNISEEEFIKIKNNRIDDLSKPEKSQNFYIIIGYICVFFGGLLGIFIGWHLSTFKKTIPNGEVVYNYSEIDRKHGKILQKIGVISFILWIILIVLFKD